MSRKQSGRKGIIRHPILWWGTGLIILSAAIASAALILLSGGSSRAAYPYPVQTFASQGRDHMPPGQTYDGYNSNPPTSGPHTSVPAPWGVSNAELPKEVPVHNMEHGGVVIWYNCNGGPAPLDAAACQNLRDQLAAITNAAVANKKEVLMTPYSAMPHRIALTAWQNLDAFDDFDATRVQDFIASFERKFNPEGF